MTRCLIVLFSAAIFLIPAKLSLGEFYEYIDENGVRTFTDDAGGIPEARHDEVMVHPEQYDGLTEDERQQKIAADQAEIMAIEKEREEYRQRRERLMIIRKLEEEKARKQKEQEALRTPVTIAKNQILVPVTLSYLNKKVETTLLLDTGANITVISEAVAEKLSLDNGLRSSAQVANGQTVKTSVAQVQSIQVGPKSISGHRVAVVPFVGKERNFDGLLGLDFLKHFGYDIDYRNSRINWKE